MDPLGRGERRIERLAIVRKLDDNAMRLSADGNGRAIGVAMRDGVEEQLFKAKSDGEVGLPAEAHGARLARHPILRLRSGLDRTGKVARAERRPRLAHAFLL